MKDMKIMKGSPEKRLTDFMPFMSAFGPQGL